MSQSSAQRALDATNAREVPSARHEVEVERRRPHPGEPRRTVVTDRPAPSRDRRGSHAYADPARYR